MVDLPPVAWVQPRKQLIAYDTASQMPIAQAQGAGQLAPILQAVMQGGQAVAEGFSLPEMMAQYARATDPVASQNMSGLERLFATNPAINTMAGSLFGRLPQGAVFGSSALRRQGDNALPQVDEIVAYHGSPHDFDKFQMDKIGTGEGAQAFGHGLYYTDLEDIATGYKDKLSLGNAVTYKGKPVLDLDSEGASYEESIAHMIGQQTNLNDRTRVLNNEIASMRNGLSGVEQAIKDFNTNPVAYPLKFRGLSLTMDDAVRIKNDFAERLSALNEIEKNFNTIKTKPTGKTYKVSIQSKLDDMLDYDEFLSDQPKILSKIEDAYGDSEIIILQLGLNPQTATGGDLVKALAGTVGDMDSQKAASNWLLKAGISGTKYLDGSARNTFGGRLLDIEESNGQFTAKVKLDSAKRQTGMGGKGMVITKSRPYKTKEEAQKWADNAIKRNTRNYVIFDEDLVKILAKYGIVGGAGLAAANEFSSPAQADSYPNYMPPQAPELDANPLPTLPPNMV